MSTKVREVSVIMEDSFAGQPYGFNMQFFPFSIVKSSYTIIFSLGKDDLYEQFKVKKSDIESFKEINGLEGVSYPVVSEPEIAGGNAYAKVISFSEPKTYDVICPYVRDWRDTESLLSGHYSCTCESGKNTRHEINLNGCSHMISLIDGMSLKGGTHHLGFASDEMNGAVAGIIRKDAREYQKKMSSGNFYKLFPDYPDKLKKIVRDNFIPRKKA